MSWEVLAILMFGGLLLLLAAGIPVAFGLGFIGLIGSFLAWGTQAPSVIVTTAYNACANYLLTALPLFILMGEAAMWSGVTEDAFRALDPIMGRLPGGLAVTTVGTAAIFGAVSGVSIAACAAVGTMALPEMFRRGYDKGLAIGAVGGGAVLDILIPPSIVMVMFGFLSGVSIGSLLFAGLIPGLVAAGLYSIYIMARCILNPGLAPERSRASLKETITSFVGILPLLILMVAVLGSIWFGIATPTEAAGIGALGSMLLTIGYRKMTYQVLKTIMFGTLKVTCMIFFIIMGATLFTQILVYLGIIVNIAKTVSGLEIAPWLILAVMMLIVIFLGCFLDAGSIMFICTPIFMPVIVKLGFDPLWFGILFAINIGLGTITPPVGTTLYVLKGIVPDVSFGAIVRGVMPYWFLLLLTMVLVGLFPILATWLPGLMASPVG